MGLLFEALPGRRPMPGPGQSSAVPSDDQSLDVRTASWSIEGPLASLREHRHARCLTMRDVQQARRDNGVLDVLETIGADSFVVDSEAPTGDHPHLDPGFATPALGTAYLSAVQTRRASSEK